MSSKASMFHHPLHPMLITFPLGLWFTSIIFDVWYSYSPPKYQIPPEISYYCIIAGVVGAGAAALPGMVDYLTLRDDKAVRGTATLHMLLNIVALAIFGADAYLRSKVPDHRTSTALVLSGIGGTVLSFSAWLGHSLVYRYGVGVEPAKKD